MELQAKNPYLITITSGKGGVGKSVLASNIASKLAENGAKTLIWDANSQFPNQHILLGVEPPVRINECYAGRIPVTTAVFDINNNLSILADMPAAGKKDEIQSEAVIEVYKQILMDMDFDYIIVDTPAGVHDITLTTCKIADMVNIVITDEPTSLLDAYGLLKILLNYIDNSQIKLLVNNVIDNEDADEISTKLNMATKKFLNIELEAFGFVPYDRIVRQSILKQDLFTKTAPDSEASLAISKLCDYLISKIHVAELR